MLSACEIIEADCIFILIDSGIVPDDACRQFMEYTYHKNYEMFVLLNWLLRRWVLVRKHKFHLPKRRTNKSIINLTNLINSNST